ncbi:MAG: URC4/urg3 family protein, partial [Rhodospirillales bacterium]|nr:URC4/urg3 family protein [Rhodospirillales bacterium]
MRSPAAIRERCNRVLAAAETGQLAHFALAPERLEDAAAYTVATIRQNYPDLVIPYHSRWRHFAVGGRDRWAQLAAGLGAPDPREIARIRFDLAVTSVLLDAGAGAGWRFTEPGTGEHYRRSEGLGVASFHLFRSGGFSADP